MLPYNVIEITKKAVFIWYSAVMPSLFPYFLIINILIQTNYFYLISIIFKPIARFIFNVSSQGFLGYVIGLFAGYPIGIKTICDLLENKKISYDEARLLIMFVNNSSPLFIIGTIGINIFDSFKMGMIIYLSHIISSIIIAIIIMHINKNRLNIRNKFEVNININVGEILYSSITNAINSILLICGFITLFMYLNFLLNYIGIYNFICNILALFNFNRAIIKSILFGFFEITNGIYLLKDISLSIITKSIIATFIVSWGGWSVHFQAISFLEKIKCPIKYYIIGKIMHSIFSVIIIVVLISIYYS